MILSSFCCLNIIILKVSFQLKHYINVYDPYPNPFNPEVTVKYTVGRESDVVIKIYDLLGREVLELIREENVQKGDYSIILNTERRNLSSGIYFIEFISLDNGKQIYKKTKKINLIK
ncbi:MAG: T9SS type A sorting domain-containing protein [Ignavibacteriaceae bacterium]